MDNVTVNASTHPYWDFLARHGWTLDCYQDEDSKGWMVDIYRPDGTYYSCGALWTPDMPDGIEAEIETALAVYIVEDEYGKEIEL